MASKELVAAQYRRYLKQGASKEEAQLRIQQQYGETVGMDAAAAPAKAPEPTEIQKETARTVLDKTVADARLTRLKSGTFTPNTAQDIVDAGLKFNAAASDVLNYASNKPRVDTVRELNRVSNAIELTAGSAAWMASRPQQVLFGLMMGEGARAFNRARLTVAKQREELVGTQNDLDTIDQMSALTMEDATKLASVNLLNDPEALDMEPYIMERTDNDLTFQDVLFKHLPEDKVDSFLQNHKKTGIVLGAALGTAGDFFADPLWFMGGISKGLGELKYLPKAMEVAKNTEGLNLIGKAVVARGVMKAEASFSSQLVKTVKARTAAGKLVAEAMEQVDKTPQEVEALRALDQAQRKYMELDTAVREMAPGSKDVLSPADVVAKVGPPAAPELGKQLSLSILEPKAPTRRNPATVLNAAETPAGSKIKTKGRSAASIRKEAMALSHASVEEVEAALTSRGWESLSKFQDDMRAVNKAIKDDARQLSNEAYDILNRYENLPSRVRAHLHEKGWGRDRIFRQQALASAPFILEQQAGLSKEALEQLATLGPSDSQETADAARRLALGAHGEDVTVHSAIIPEYDVANHAPVAEWGDGKWIAEHADDPRRVRLQKSGVWVTPESVQRKLSFGGRRSIPGLLPGSRHLRVPEIVTGRLNPLVEGTRDFLNGWRQPVNALGNRIAYQILRDAHGSYMGDVVKSENWYAHMLQDNGWGKMNKYGKLVYNGDESREAVRGVFQMLDATDDLDLAAKLAKASDGQTKVYYALRQWFDQAAKDLNLPEGMFIRHYAPHMFPWADFKNGARPLEFANMPITASVGFDRLKVRHGAEGYTDDLNMVYQSYVRGRYRKQHMEPAYEAMLNEAEKLRSAGTKKYMDGTTHQHGAYLSQADYIEDLVKDAKGYPAPLDKVIQRDLDAAFPEVDFMKMGRATKSALRFTALHYMGMLAGRPGYFLQNIASAVATQMGSYGPFRTVWGFLATSAPTKQGAMWRKIAEESGAFGQLTNAMQQLDEGKFARTMQKIGRYSGVQHSEDQIRAMTWHNSMSEQLSELGMNWEQAKEAGLAGKIAKQAVLDTEFSQHVYGTLGRSPKWHQYLGRGPTSVLLMFKSFPFKHAEFLLSLGKKNPGLFARYMAYSGWMTRVAAEAGLDIGHSVGLAPMAPGSGDEPQLWSPPVQTLIAHADAAWQFGQRLMGRSDSQRMQDALDNMVKATENMVPFSQPVAAGYKRWMDGLSGARRDKEGGIERRFDASPITGVVTPDGQLNPDMLPLYLNVRGIEDARAKMDLDQKREQMRENAYQLNRYTKLIQRAYDAGNMEEVKRLSQEAIMKHGVYGGHKGIVSQEHAAMLERRTRMVLDNIKAFPPAVIKEIVDRETEARRRLDRERGR